MLLLCSGLLCPVWALAATAPPPAPPRGAPALPPGAAHAGTPAAPPATAPTAASRTPASPPAPIATQIPRDTHALLYRLDQCLRQFTRDYHRVPQYRPSLRQLDTQLDEIEALLWQLRQRQMPTDRQITLFKTEMQIRRVRETVPDQ